MNTIFTDNSLCGREFSDAADQPLLGAYIDCLHKVGVKFCETDAYTLDMLPEQCDFSRLIFRVQSEDELDLANSRDFGYVCLPEEFIKPYAGLMKNPIIADLSPNGENFLVHIMQFSADSGIDKLSMIRVTDDFEESGLYLTQMIELYDFEAVVPLDICPKNNKLNALACVMSALAARVPCITLRFGSFDEYAELRDVLFTLSKAAHTSVPDEILQTIAMCGVLYNRLFGSPAMSISKNAKPNAVGIDPGVRIDEPLTRLRRVNLNNDKEPATLLARRLQDMNVEPEDADDLEKAIRSFLIDFYK